MTNPENAAGLISPATRDYTDAERRTVGARPYFHAWPLQLQLTEVPVETRLVERLPLETEDRLRQEGADPFLPAVAAAFPGFKVIAARYADRDEAAAYTLVPEA